MPFYLILGLSVTTETTDISMSMCSLNSTTTSQPEGGDYTNSTATEHQIGKCVYDLLV